MMALSASHRRAADSTSVCSTAWRSKVERLITLSTSAVAVCCCSDSRSSLSRRVFSMAMTACAAKLLTSSICLSLNGLTSWRKIPSAPTSSFSLSIGTHIVGRWPLSSTDACLRQPLGFCLQRLVGHGPLLKNRVAAAFERGHILLRWPHTDAAHSMHNSTSFFFRTLSQSLKEDFAILLYFWPPFY